MFDRCASSPDFIGDLIDIADWLALVGLGPNDNPLQRYEAVRAALMDDLEDAAEMVEVDELEIAFEAGPA